MPEGAAVHRVLARQMRRAGLEVQGTPTPEQWAGLLGVISDTYAQGDSDRYTLERAIELSSTEMQGLHAVLRERALTDSLTGLPNRAALNDHLRDLVAARGRSGAPFAVLFVDIDDFKLVNDSFGHDMGDVLLIAATARMSETVGASHIVARLGGDEFVIVCPDLSTTEEARLLSARLIGAMDAPFTLGGQDAVVTASIGMALTFPHETDGEPVLRRADLAMYRAKKAGRARYEVFDEDMQRDADRRVSIRAALTSAIPRGELVVHYQPVVRLSDEQVIGAEALVRWHRPGLGMVPPNDFIPVAEEGPLIADVDAWVMREACRRTAEWCRRGGDIAVNLSPRSLESTDVVDVVSTALRVHGIEPSSLVVELTEESLVSSNPQISGSLESLRRLGIRIAIDDFGTGYSSLARLRTIPVDILKLDRSLILTMDENENEAAIVGAAITMGHALGHSVIVEGIERRAQADLLRALGCDSAQGYYFGRPAPPEELDAILLAREVRPRIGRTVPPLPHQDRAVRQTASPRRS